MSTSMMEAACRYVAEGWEVFPAHSSGAKKSHKAARHTGGRRWGATTDPEEVRRDWRKWPKANVGITTGAASGFFVVEADTPAGHNVDGIASLRALEAKNSPLPKTRTAKSPSGSVHYYFKWPEGPLTVSNSASTIAKGVDVRGEAGMVIAPPSVRPGKGAYRWEVDGPIAPAPGWLLDLIVEAATRGHGSCGGDEATQGPRPSLELAREVMAAIPNDFDYDGWARLGLALKNSCGPELTDANGLELFDEFSRRWPKYDESATRQKWRELKPNGKLGFGTLVYLARKAGWRGVASSAQWRECYRDGSPRPSLHNAREAITASGVECRHDTFHDKILVGYRGGDTQHEFQSIVGEASDNSTLALRRIISDRFGFDPTRDHTHDAIVSLALENRFNPVLDMLTEAEGAWDNKERLDRFAVDYLNCADTPYNRAVACNMMVGAVRRARQPGCKRDEIVVLESKEGWNKSGAFRVLAGDENFSDESILGKSGKEVQEQLAGVWLHENAELAGLRKAEVEKVKAFASRQEDIARPAYGRFVIRQKRHSIEVGSTNSDEYLQSQNGNRRFAPLKVLKPIDLDLLRRDRLQLWGEAASRESAGESITLDESLWPAAGEQQEKRRTKDPWEDILDNIPTLASVGGRRDDEGNDSTGEVQIVYKDHGYEKVSSADLLTHVLRINIDRQEPKHTMRLAQVMKQLGWERPQDGNKLTINKRQVRGYMRPAAPACPDLTQPHPDTKGGEEDEPLGPEGRGGG